MNVDRETKSVSLDEFLEKQRTERVSSLRARAVEPLATDPEKVMVYFAAEPFPALAVRVPKQAIKEVRTPSHGACSCNRGGAGLEVVFQDVYRELVVDLLSDILLQYGRLCASRDNDGRGAGSGDRFRKCNFDCMDPCYADCNQLEPGPVKLNCVRSCWLGCCR